MTEFSCLLEVAQACGVRQK